MTVCLQSERRLFTGPPALPALLALPVPLSMDAESIEAQKVYVNAREAQAYAEALLTGNGVSTEHAAIIAN
ncbi:hypothetical protein J0J21_23035, partial [Vibrio vulnificus]|uniref:hypothetical protein n=1 Tax=Vibrio vulnificus TaxID=672 RepID=UPI0019D43146